LLPPEKDEDVILMHVEDVFSSKPRMKILKLLSRLGAVNVSEIARRISLNYSTTKKHLILLEAEGIIQQTVYGRIRIYKFNEVSLKARAVRNLIEVWEQVNKQSSASNLGDK
jgi:DNA-binding transcriptional ArsR family regulator